MDEVEAGGQALVLPEFAAALEAVAAESGTRQEPVQTVVNEIVLECPVVIEFVGEDVSDAADALTTALLDGLAGVMRDA